MKRPVKRILSAVLALLLCVSLLSGLSFAATVNYQTGDPEGFRNVILNWGKRGTTATFLSPNAIEFYEDNNITYSELAQLSGSSNISSTPSSQLYKALQKLMKDNHEVITSYADTRPLYSYTDCQNGNRNELTCFYSGIKIGPNWDSGATWNREHTWPNSKGMDGDDENDIMMLRPASSSVNSSRGNNAYGESANFYDPNDVTNGALNLHGDVARIFLYVYVRWGNTANPWGTNGVIESKDVLLRWMEEDPVDTWEMGRNDSVESITGTRNVFVDYPELAFALFDAQLPTTMTTPSGEAINSGSTYSITVQTNNSAWGNATLSGKTVNAAPATGYRVAGYTLVSGNATVTRNGNAFTVEPSSDCTIRINFEERTEASVRFFENGVETSAQSVYIDDSYTLPEPGTEVPEGYHFQGWVTSELAETTAKPALIHASGKVLTAEEDVTYYALYSRLDASGTGSSSSYELYDGELVAGSYLITYNNGAMKASITSGRLDLLTVTPVANAIDEPDPSTVWEISFTDDGYVTLYNKASNYYAAGTGVKNKAALLAGVNDYAKWTPSGEGTYEFINYGNELKGVNKNLRRNADFGFACYAASTGGALTLYKQAGGTVYYCTTAAVCEHANTRNEAAVDASCTENGYTAGIYCLDCNSYISGHEPVTAPGHDYEAMVTPPEGADPGYTTYTCTVCGDSYRGGDQFRVSFVVPAGTAPVEALLCDQSGITLPTAQTPESDKGYRFVGWTTAPLEDSTAAPTVLKGSYVARENITLYALYSYTVGATGNMGWQLVTDGADLSAGDSVVLAANQKGKVATDIYSQYLTDVNATFSGDLAAITDLPDSAIIFTLGTGENGSWTLTNQAGQQLCSSALKKVNWDRGVGTWTISIDENALATVTNTNTAYGYFMYNVNSPRFTTYTSSPTASMLMPQLYKLEGSLGTTYYTTEIEGEGVTLSGTITTGTGGDATVELLSGENVIATVTASGTYRFENVAAGSYTLRVSKLNHVTREYAVTVAAEAVAQDVKICLLGDADGNGKINMGDIQVIYAHVTGNQTFTDDYIKKVADVTGETRLNMGDINKLYAHVRGVSLLY